MTAQLKVDEDLPCEIADLLSAHGHDVVSVAARGWTGTPDVALWPLVQNEGR